MSGRTKPGELREDFVYAHDIGWQATAHTVAALIRTYPDRWAQLLKRGLVASIGTVQTRTGKGIAMVGTRINNTGPGIRAGEQEDTDYRCESQLKDRFLRRERG
jgi:DNA sulfur modification protein DndB